MLTDIGPRVFTSSVDYDVEERIEPVHFKNLALLQYWSSKADAAGTIHRRDINPVDLKKVLGGFFIVEPVDNDTDLLYRLVGYQNESRLGIRCMGRRFSECYAPAMAADQVAFHLRVAATGKPAFLSGRLLGLNLEYVNFEASYLPVCTDDGGWQMIGGLYDLAEQD